MKNKILLCMILIVTLMLNVLNDNYCKEYKKLKPNGNKSIKLKDLPPEFSENAFKTINDFIKKTQNLDYECALFFDYISGEILKCGIGVNDNVKLYFNVGEFIGKHVASIHNHPKNAFGPPSGKNFNILSRIFEDYELIVGRDGLWILKAKGTYEELIGEMRETSMMIYLLSLVNCEDSNRTLDEINECEDSYYGKTLSNYINNKNINDIQLTKKEYKYD